MKRLSLKQSVTAVLLLTLATLARADKLDEVLSHMDSASSGFAGMSASISYTKLTVIVEDKDVKTGGMHLEKEKNGYKIKIDFTSPDPQSVLLKNGKVEIYHPKIDQEEIYEIGKNQGAIEQFYALGFGGGGHTLTKSYDVALGAEEKVGDVNAVKLSLTPKNKMPGNFVKVEIWLSPVKWTPLRQRFTEQSKDYLEITYSNVLEGKQPESVFNIKEVSGKTKKVFPGK